MGWVRKNAKVIAPIAAIASFAIPGVGAAVGSGLSSLFGGGAAAAGATGSGLSSLFTVGNALKVAGAYNDYRNAKEAENKYEGATNTLNSMYMPGSPEAQLMEQQLAAKDAAAGRNSQYGTRAVQLGQALAAERGKIMTNPVYGGYLNSGIQNSNNSLNSMFSVAGGLSSQLGIGNTNLMNLFGGK